MIKENIFTLLTVFILFSAISCEELFDMSPYEAAVEESYKNTSLINIKKLAANTPDDSITFIVLADPHYDYYHLNKAVEKINHDYSIDFVICAGDIADKGLLKEYELSHDALSKLEVPWFTVIGNHDYRANGGLIYFDMFGNYNYTVNCSFLMIVFFDDIFWESDKYPDFDWLDQQTAEGDDVFKIVVTHIPPLGDQFSDDESEQYYSIMEKNHVNLSLHGHTHTYEYYIKENIGYVISDDTGDSHFTLIKVYSDKTYSVANVKF